MCEQLAQLPHSIGPTNHNSSNEPSPLRYFYPLLFPIKHEYYLYYMFLYNMRVYRFAFGRALDCSTNVQRTPLVTKGYQAVYNIPLNMSYH